MANAPILSGNVVDNVNFQVGLSWQGVTGVTQYKVYRSTNTSSGFTHVATKTTATAGENVSLFWVNFPNDNYVHYYRVSSVDAGGESALSGEYASSAQTPNIPVISPTDAEILQSTSISITGQAGLQIRYTTNGSEPTISSTLYSGSFTPATTGSYTVKAKAFKVYVNATLSSETATKTYNVLQVPAIPSNVRATTITDDSIRVEWNAEPISTSYKVNFSKADGSGATQITTSNLYYVFTGLARGKQYKFSVAGVNTAGTGLFSSEVFATTTGSNILAEPTFSLASGIYTTPQTLSLSTTETGSQIRYTMDGSEPTISSTLYSTALNINSTVIVKAKTFKTDYTASSTVTRNYTITGKVSNPTITASSEFLESINVTITVPASANVRYTTDGSTPSTTSGILITENSTIQITETTTVKAIAFRTDWDNSDIVSSTFTKVTIQAPTLSLASGIYTTPQTLTITTNEVGGQTRYTIDGTEPTISSTLYSTALNINSTITIKAKSFRNGMGSSTVTRNYEITGKVSNPTITSGTFFDDTQEVTITVPASANVRYTTDGSPPSTTSGILITENSTIQITETTTIKAIAYRLNWDNSEIVSETFTKFILEPPTFSLNQGIYDEDKVLMLNSSVPGGVIRFTVTGTEPNENSPIYSDPISITKTVTVKAKTFYNSKSSSTNTGKYIIIKGGIQMGLPQVKISFESKIVRAIRQGAVGVLAVVLKDSSVTAGVKEYKLTIITDIPSELSDTNKEYLNLAFTGQPKEIKAVVIPATEANYNVALDYLETIRFNIVCFPGVSDSESATIGTWTTGMRLQKERKVISVLPNSEADAAGVINFVTTNIKVGEKTYNPSQFTARIAGIIAGLPLTVSPTYRVLRDVDDITRLTKAEADAEIDAGKLILYHDGEKVKIGRGVTSLQTIQEELTEANGNDWKKIKVVRILDLVYTDIKNTIEDEYIGSVQNGYTNKILLITAINTYLKALEQANILDAGKNMCDIDIAAQKTYLNSIGEDADNMTVQEIRQANTRDKVFITAKIRPLDAIEDVNIEFLL